METDGAYGVAARRHWWTAALLALLFPLGIAMTIRGNCLNTWDSLTNALYGSHKLPGVTAFFVVAARLRYRLGHGAPESEPAIGPSRRCASRIAHRAIYALLPAMPVAGWFGVQLYPALDVFGLFPLPAVVAPDRAASAWVMALHGVLAFSLLALHVAAALHHRFVRGDGVLWRMYPGTPPERRWLAPHRGGSASRSAWPTWAPDRRCACQAASAAGSSSPVSATAAATPASNCSSSASSPGPMRQGLSPLVTR